MKKLFTIILFILFCFTSATAQNSEYIPKINGTIRARYEIDLYGGKSRFQVRNARLAVSGKISKMISYKAEIDFCDAGEIKVKMLEASIGLQPIENLKINFGQLRMPIGMDSFRSPHLQYFTTNSFISDQITNVRDVGITVGYDANIGFPAVFEVAAFNGLGVTNQTTWLRKFGFAAKAQFMFFEGFNFTTSFLSIQPQNVRMNVFDVGAYYKFCNFHVEAEYALKMYEDNLFQNVHTLNTFVNYDIYTPTCNWLEKVSVLARYDYMDDHSNGVFVDGETNLIISDYARQRITAGTTLHLPTKYRAEIRLNYECYFYREGALFPPNEESRVILEFMVRF